jgi:hypothetical protein
VAIIAMLAALLAVDAKGVRMTTNRRLSNGTKMSEEEEKAVEL